MRILAAVLLLAACDPGGSIREREFAVAAQLADGTHGRIVGLCMSACLMRLAVDCVDPSAVLVMHAPTPDTPRNRAWLARFMPPEIAALQMGLPVGTGFYSLTGAEAIGLGATECGLHRPF